MSWTAGLLITTCWLVGITRADTENMSTLIEKVFNGYDRKLAPKYDRVGFEQQVPISVNLFIVSMYSISEVNMEYSMSFFIRERWVDERLAYNTTSNISRLELDNSLFDNVWVPDLYILNEKQSQSHDVTVPNKMIHIYPNGTVQYSMRVTGTFSCLMYLRKYPFDTQECNFEVESYGHSTETLKFRWSDDPLSLADDMVFPQFKLTNYETYTCEKNYYGIVYPCIGLKFVLERNYNYHLIQIYIPTILLVVLSWVNFWLDQASVPARISLALLTVLSVTTQSEGTRTTLPKVSYIKAIDVWMAMCLTFVFMALIEFAFVNVQSRKAFKKQNNSKNNSKNSSSINDEEKANGVAHHSEVSVDDKSCWERTCFKRCIIENKARAIDKVSRWLFPLVFILFNILYWLYYFHWLPDRPPL